MRRMFLLSSMLLGKIRNNVENHESMLLYQVWTLQESCSQVWWAGRQDEGGAGGDCQDGCHSQWCSTSFWCQGKITYIVHYVHQLKIFIFCRVSPHCTGCPRKPRYQSPTTVVARLMTSSSTSPRRPAPSWRVGTGRGRRRRLSCNQYCQCWSRSYLQMMWQKIVKLIKQHLR